MNKLEELEQEAFDKNINVYDYYLGESDLKGVYMDGNIALNTTLETITEKVCVLAEEIGHHETTVGSIADMKYANDFKQERHARLWAYNKLVGLRGLINSYEYGCQNLYEAAEYLEVTEEFLGECIEYYRNIYGVMVTVDNYCVIFIPHFMVGKIIN